MKEVVYNVKGFIKKNRTKLSSQLITLLKSSENKIIKEIFASSKPEDDIEENLSYQIIIQAFKSVVINCLPKHFKPYKFKRPTIKDDLTLTHY